MSKKILRIVLMFAVAACTGPSGSGIATLAPLHDVYEATNVALPDGSGNGSIVFAFSENGTAGSNVSGELVLISPIQMTRLPLQSGTVTRAGSTATIQGLALDRATARTTVVSGSFSSAAFTYSLNGTEVATGTANRVASYIDNGTVFAAPSGSLGTFSYFPENTSCVNGTVYVAISGAQPDGNGLWRPQGAVSIGTPPPPAQNANDGVWDQGHVFVLVNLGGFYSTPTLSVTLTGAPSAASSGVVAQFGATPCTTPITPPLP